MVNHAYDPARKIELLHQIGELYELAGEDSASAFNTYGRALREAAFRDEVMARGVSEEDYEVMIPLDVLEAMATERLGAEELEAARARHTSTAEEGAEPTLDGAAYRRELEGCPGIVRVWTGSELVAGPPQSETGRLFAHAFHPDRSPDLMVQLEGTENRIAVARRDYIDAVRVYNTLRRRFPANVIAGMFGFDAVPQLQIEEGERETPQVDFDFEKNDG